MSQTPKPLQELIHKIDSILVEHGVENALIVLKDPDSDLQSELAIGCRAWIIGACEQTKARCIEATLIEENFYEEAEEGGDDE